MTIGGRQSGREYPEPRPRLDFLPRRRRLLLAEDDAPLRQVLATALGHDGFDVLEAGDGLELLERIENLLAASVRPDDLLVIADIHMPGLTGLDLVAILSCALAGTPVVLITAFADRETRAEASELGAVAVIDKPFSLDELRAVIFEAADA
jgi:two-component system response regulator (stage 0 sporulation protein F)